MWFLVIVCGMLGLAGVIGRVLTRRPDLIVPAAELLPPLRPIGQGCTVVLRAAPGAPNTDPPTDRHESARGSAVITRRVGRRRSTTTG